MYFVQCFLSHKNNLKSIQVCRSVLILRLFLLDLTEGQFVEMMLKPGATLDLKQFILGSFIHLLSPSCVAGTQETLKTWTLFFTWPRRLTETAPGCSPGATKSHFGSICGRSVPPASDKLKQASEQSERRR